jgi:DNA-binding MarR family transcriptional regulator
MAKTKAPRQQVLPLVEYLARLGRRAYEGTMPTGGLRPRHTLALRLLSEHGPQSQQGLAEALSLDPSNVVGLLNELEDRELVVRRRDRADRRRHVVELAPLGEKALTAAYARLKRAEDEIFASLTADERSTLYDLLQRAAGVAAPPDYVAPEDVGNTAWR